MINVHPSDRNEYKQTILSNNLRVTTISRNDLDKASVSLVVNAGGFNDPEEYQGLAHFVEHLLFMGSEKYPCENEFTDFLSLHNGTYNAYTCEEKTVFYLEIDREYLFEACDILAQFFISPLFNEDSVLREVNAVDSEFLNRLNSDYIRTDHIYNITCKSTAPNNRFLCGNLKSLSKPNLRQQVINFWEKYYNQMDLVIYGRESNEILIDFAKKTFGLIKNLKTPLNFFEKENYKKISKTILHDFPLFVEIEPFADIKSLLILINLPTGYKLLYNQYEYFIYCLEKTGSGSLINILKKKELIYDLNVSINSNSIYTNFELEFSLTKKGNENIKNILQIYANYEITFHSDFLEYLDFQFKLWETPNATDHCLELANVVHLIPFENIFEYKKLYNFNIEIFNEIKNNLQNFNNWTVFHSSKNLTFMQKEDLYGINYNCNNLLSVFKKNDILPIKFSTEFLKPKNTKEITKHEYSTSNYRLLVLKSEKFVKNDEMIIFLRFLPNLINNQFLLKIFYEMFEENYCKIITQKNSEINFCFYDFGIEISLISKDLESLVEILINEVNGIQNYLIKNSPYKKIVKEMIYEKLKLIEKEPPYKTLTRNLGRFIYKSKTTEELLNDLKNVSYEKISPEFMDIFVSGSINEIKSKELCEKIFKVFEFKNEVSHKLENLKIIKEPKNLQKLVNNSVNIESKSNDKNNNACGIFLKVKEGLLNSTKVNLIFNFSNEQFFDKLRTKDQLGYIVFNRKYYFLKNMFLGFVVQSERDCEFLFEKIKSFIFELPTIFPENKFEEFKKSLENSLNEEFVNQTEFIDHHYNLWQRGYQPLDFKKESLKILKGLKFEDINFDELFDASFCIKVVKSD